MLGRRSLPVCLPACRSVRSVGRSGRSRVVLLLAVGGWRRDWGLGVGLGLGLGFRGHGFSVCLRGCGVSEVGGEEEEDGVGVGWRFCWIRIPWRFGCLFEGLCCWLGGVGCGGVGGWWLGLGFRSRGFCVCVRGCVVG